MSMELLFVKSVEKRRASAYHSQGNGFAERSIRNVKEMLRCHLYANSIPQVNWRRTLTEMVFVLNTTISCATKCVPYEVVHGRQVILPVDVNVFHTRSSTVEKLDFQ